MYSCINLFTIIVLNADDNLNKNYQFYILLDYIVIIIDIVIICLI